MSKRYLALLVVSALLGCAIWTFSPSAKADIEQGFKAELIAAANGIAADAEDFRQLVRTEVSGEIIKAKGKATEALALLKRRNGIQTSVVNAAIDSAKTYIEQAQTGVNAARAFKEFYLVKGVDDLSGTIDWGLTQTPSLITQTEADELKGILNNCLGGCLTETNWTLVDISKYLMAATSALEEAQAYLRISPSPSRRDLRKAKWRVSFALRKLKSAFRAEMRIKDNVKCLIYGLYTFKKTVLLASLKASGLALSGELKVLGTGIGGGPIRFLVLGPEVKALRVQVFSLAGRPIYDSGFLAGSMLEWHPLNNQGEPLANGVYLYVVTARSLDGSIVRSEVRKLVILR